jgi:hypothetical protein
MRAHDFEKSLHRKGNDGHQGYLSQFEYICIEQPSWDHKVCDDWFEFEKDCFPADDSTFMRRELELETPGKLAANHPDWKWRIMRVSHDLVGEWRNTRTCEPRPLGSFLYNDFFANSLQEAQENVVSLFVSGIESLMGLTSLVQLVRFDDEFRKDGKSFRMLWAIMVSLMHWQLHEHNNWSR